MPPGIRTGGCIASSVTEEARQFGNAGPWNTPHTGSPNRKFRSLAFRVSEITAKRLRRIAQGCRERLPWERRAMHAVPQRGSVRLGPVHDATPLG